MLVSGPQRGIFLASLTTGVACLLALDLVFAPAALAEDAATTAPASAPPTRGPTLPPSTTTSAAAQVDPATRVPTIVARFDTSAKEPADESAIRALATAMIQNHDVTVVLEGHSDTQGAEDYNHQISLERADWVKARLVALGVSPERVETVGLGATRPLRNTLGDAQAVNRRVEVRWVGR